jgi:hypothetical protein
MHIFNGQSVICVDIITGTALPGSSLPHTGWVQSSGGEGVVGGLDIGSVTAAT